MHRSVNNLQELLYVTKFRVGRQRLLVHVDSVASGRYSWSNSQNSVNMDVSFFLRAVDVLTNECRVRLRIEGREHRHQRREHRHGMGLSMLERMSAEVCLESFGEFGQSFVVLIVGCERFFKVFKLLRLGQLAVNDEKIDF